MDERSRLEKQGVEGLARIMWSITYCCIAAVALMTVMLHLAGGGEILIGAVVLSCILLVILTKTLVWMYRRRFLGACKSRALGRSEKV